jgi:membrane protein DedA with SNARE-associated domain
MFEHRLLVLVARYGPLTVFFGQVFGIFGLPIPDEFMLTVAGALARAGRLNLASLLFAAISGCLCGITLSYVLGRTVGATALRRVGHVSDAALLRGQRWFHRFGGWLLMFGYFVPGVRHVTAIAAGSAPIGYGEFARFAYPGGVLWSVSFVMLGYYAGNRWRAVAAFGHTWLPAIVIVLAGVITTIVFIIRRRRPKAS